VIPLPQCRREWRLREELINTVRIVDVEIEPAAAQEKNPLVVRAGAIVHPNQRRSGRLSHVAAVRSSSEIRPQVDREVVRTEFPSVVPQDRNRAASAKAEPVANLSVPEGCVSVQRSIVAGDQVVGIPIARPPTDHARWRSNTRGWTRHRSWRRSWRRRWLALTRAAGVVDVLYFRLSERAIKEFYLVN
jgi:hypothetical protein